MNERLRKRIRERLAGERGTIFKDAPFRVTLAYPNTYAVAMASLGFQTVYRLFNAEPDFAAERAFLEDAELAPPGRLVTYESGRYAGDAHIFGISVAFELDLVNVVRLLRAAGLEPLREARDPDDPPVLVGGPLTSSNPWPLAPFADVILIGDGEEMVPRLAEAYRQADSKAAFLDLVEGMPGVFLPDRDRREPHWATAPLERLPVYSQIVAQHAEFPGAFLVEAERGCPRPCTFCLARTMYGPTRNVPAERVLEVVPEGVTKVGLVGAALSDYPHVKRVGHALLERGIQLSVSSIRADRVDRELAELLKAGGLRTFTIASDGPSQRLRDLLKKQITEEHLLRAAELAREVGFRGFKLYQMIGLPTEADEDIEEMLDFTRRVAEITPVALGISPFVPKRHTPHFGDRFAGIKTIEARLKRIQKALRRLRPRVEVRSTSAKWAWIEAVIARGGPEVGLAALRLEEGESFAGWKRALEEVGWHDPLTLPEPEGAAVPLVLG
ncbi:radical SAM protein [Oceanithermus sp.]|uniref:B12-binding domain-containing radical SAM protein n=1 Tax=Oceanithermus sp. TaxID=2268145 RepID=UPI0025CFC617|nr:radical SAM protein [Oceanithermus sp.]